MNLADFSTVPCKFSGEIGSNPPLNNYDSNTSYFAKLQP
jgi:hypothetical protein